MKDSGLVRFFLGRGMATDRRRGGFALQVLLTLLLVAIPSPALAERSKERGAGQGGARTQRAEAAAAALSPQHARAEYERLNAADPKVENLLVWEKTGAKLEAALEAARGADDRAQLLFLLGELYEHTYRERSFQPGLAKATYFYELLARDHRSHRLVPDGLLRLGDLRNTGLKDPVAARAAYFEIVDVYAGTAAAAKAKDRLADVDERGGESGGENADAAAKLSGFSLFGGGRDESGGRDIIVPQEAPPPAAVPRPVVVIDPGHGGDELGAIGIDGLLEKEVTLEISLLLDELLRERLRAKTVLTRTKDTSLPLAERTRIANDNNADLFISIHTNASEYKTAKGVETYYLDNTNDKASLKLAERENASLAKGGDDLGFIISDFIQNAKLGESISLAHHVQDSLQLTLTRYYEGVKGLGVKKAPFYVLVGAHMPCVLIEVSFIDHPVEGKRLASRRYQKLIASAIYQGVKAYFVATAKGSVKP